jgi:tape measure domain-containing protein
LSQVNAVLAQLNTYANQTVYNFSDMAKNIGTFTAAGVGLQTSVNSIKGIANLAALSGSSADQASSAMYQLSQAIASGSVKLQDWNSVVNAGLGGKVFQTALENTARASGVAIDSIIKKTGSFRNSLQQGWLTSDILTKTLSQFTGDLSAAQLKSMGFTAQQAAQIQQLGQTAVNAATKIKTMSQLTQALKEEVGTAYAAIFKTIFGDISTATDLFTAIHNVAENALTKPIYDLNTLLQGWVQLGGRTELIADLSMAFKDLGSVMHVVVSAFEEIFPPKTAEQLYNATLFFSDLVDDFKMGANTLDELKRTLAGVFAAVDIVWQIFKDFVTVIANLVDEMKGGSGQFLEITARIGDFVVKLDDAVKNGNALTRWFQDLQNILQAPVQFLLLAGSYISGLLAKFDDDKAIAAIGTLTTKLGVVSDLGNIGREVWGEVLSILQTIGSYLKMIDDKVHEFIDSFKGGVVSAIAGDNSDSGQRLDAIVQSLNAGLFAGLLLLIQRFKNTKKDASDALGFIDTIKESFESVTKTLETMQTVLKVATLLEIAAAIAILAISMNTLAGVSPSGLIGASSAITVMFTQLIGGMKAFQKFIGDESPIKMGLMIASLLLLASAIDTMAVAVKSLSGLSWNQLSVGLTGLTVIIGEMILVTRGIKNGQNFAEIGFGLTELANGILILTSALKSISQLNWEQLAKGLTGVAGLLVSLALFDRFSGANAAGIDQGAGIILLATGIRILAFALQAMGNFSWTVIGKGLTTMAGGLTLITGALRLIPPSSSLSSVGVLVVSTSLNFIADAVRKMGNLSWTQIGKGLTTMAGGLALISAALYLIPPTSVISSAGVFVVASSLNLIADAVKKMGNMSWTEIAKGLVAMAGGLGLIAAALTLMPPSTLISAAAVFVVSTSLGMLADALVKMGGMSWTAIAKSLVELAGSLGIIGLAMILMTEALPGAAALLVVSASLRILAPVLEAFGSMGIVGIGESLLMLAGVFVVIGLAAVVLTPVIPEIISLAGAIALLGIGMLAAGAGMLLFAGALTDLSTTGKAGGLALLGLVDSMIALVPLLGKELGLAVIAFANTMTTAGPTFTKAMVTIMTSMLNAINTLAPKINSTLMMLLNLLIQDMVNEEPKMTTAGVKIIIGILNGIAGQTGKLITAGTNIIVNLISGLTGALLRVTQAAAQAVITFINGLASQIRKDGPQLGKAGANLAEAIIQGMIGGLSAGVGSLVKAAENMAGSALNAAKHALGIHSPSTEFISVGQFAGQGFSIGIDSMVDTVSDSADGMGKKAILSLQKSISGLSDQIQGNIDINPTITPVLDLSNVKQNASQIGSMLKADPITVGASYTSAKNASVGYSENQSAFLQSAPAAGTTPTPINFTQNNYSPKAISAADLYRQTKNQVSKVRGVLVYENGGND